MKPSKGFLITISVIFITLTVWFISVNAQNIKAYLIIEVMARRFHNCSFIEDLMVHHWCETGQLFDGLPKGTTP